MTTVTIDVTQDDIDQGKRENCTLCPIALAAQRVFPGKSIHVSVFNLWVDNSPAAEDGRGYPLPEVACKFLQDFDHGRPVQPFKFGIWMTGS